MRGDNTRSARCDRVGVNGGSCEGKFSRKDCNADSAPRPEGGKWVPGSRLKTLNCSNSPVAGPPSEFIAEAGPWANGSRYCFLLHQTATTYSFVQNHEIFLREVACRKRVWSSCALHRNPRDFLDLISISAASVEMKLGNPLVLLLRIELLSSCSSSSPMSIPVEIKVGFG